MAGNVNPVQISLRIEAGWFLTVRFSSASPPVPPFSIQSAKYPASFPAWVVL